MNNVRTVSDTKRAFYSQHTRPINAIYRRVVEELMVEMHLLLVNAEFSYDSIYALGVVSAFDRFMAGYEPEGDRTSIYNAIISAVESDPAQYRRDAEEILSAARSLGSIDAFKSALNEAKTSSDGALKGNLNKVISNPKFKYSRLFAIGLYNVIEAAGGTDTLDDKDKREALLDELAETFGFNADLLKKDIELYRSNLEKMAQAQEVMKDMIAADRKKQAQREADKQKRAEEKAKKEAANSEPTDSTGASSTAE